MARSKQEVINFLNSQVGHKVNAKCGIYNGQCVSLIKALLEFLGVPDPYAARGNAIDCGDTLIRQNIGENGKGWLTVVVNRDMGYIGGVHYGHIWVDLKNTANYEQNGNRALYTTKNTRPIQQGQQFVNLDKWLRKENSMVSANGLYRITRFYLGRDPSAAENAKYVGKVTDDATASAISSSAEYKKEVAELKGANKGVKQAVMNHLPGQLRG